MRKLVLMTIIVLTALAALVAYRRGSRETIVIDACADTKAAGRVPPQGPLRIDRLRGLPSHLRRPDRRDRRRHGSRHLRVLPCRARKGRNAHCSEKSTKKNPYHITCIGCHKEDKKENADTTAPTKCTACHPKDEG